MSTTDQLLKNADAYAATFDKGDLPIPPGARWPSSPAWTPG
jgi:carbonic anhydrase